MKHLRALIAILIALVLTSCACITVEKVKDSDATSGIRYSLPKPFIQVVPQADDTILVSVVYLPDKDNTYAIRTKSFMSSYSYQVTVNQNGTLSAFEYKQETSVVGQQVAASAATATTQIANAKTAQLVADQTAVNTAQGSVDSAQSAYDAAAAQVQADLKNGVTGTTLNSDKATMEAKLALLHDAKAVLDRVRSNSQVANFTATTGTPLTTTNPAPTTGASSGFGPQTWSSPVEYELPEKYGAVLYAVDEGVDSEGKPTVHLNAAQLNGESQPEFQVALLAAGPPTLTPANQTISSGSGTAAFKFTQAVYSIDACDIFTASNVKVAGAKCDFTDKSKTSDHKSMTLTLPTAPQLAVGSYKLSVGFSFQTSPNMSAQPAEAHVSFAIQ